MRFTRLRLSGFKSFVEPTELMIESGLTGVVGPNGCGKSNLLEALRWAMGESSHKSMRASGMDDVIFSGTTTRPPRNVAEVTLHLENDTAIALPGLGEAEVLEISRRIERELGSTYRLNGREVRARDVQLLFADASTGARSPALVRQGQISELINAKPQARRRILEEAAGITGLYTRRHEAELKLSAAEANLTRLDDVIGQLESQLQSLKRQARQAQRYKVLSAEIRRLEAAQLYRAWAEAEAAVAEEDQALAATTRILAEATREASAAQRERDEAEAKLPPLREAEAVRGAVLQRLRHEQESLAVEEQRAEARRAELSGQLEQIAHDLKREKEIIADGASMLGRLAEEETALNSAAENDATLRGEAARDLQSAADTLARSQERADEAAARLSELSARRGALERTVAEHHARVQKTKAELASLAEQLGELAGDEGEVAALRALLTAHEARKAAVEAGEDAVREAEEAVRQARAAEGEARGGHEQARRSADTLATEVRTLTKLLKVADGELWPPMLDAVKVAPGYERALAAALGEDLEAAADEAAPVHWTGLPPLGVPAPLPQGAEPLAAHVTAPAALARRLASIGVVDPADGRRLQAQLRPGQRLVSREGALWRWDGYTAAADAPSPAAQRLAERNRLDGLEREAEEAARTAAAARAAWDEAQAGLAAAIEREGREREALRTARQVLEQKRTQLAAEERRISERAAKRTALAETLKRLEENLAEAQAAHRASAGEMETLQPTDALKAEVEGLRGVLAEHRAAYAETRARHDGLEREARARTERLQAIAQERERWSKRTEGASSQIDTLEARAAAARDALAELAALPGEIERRRTKLLNALTEAEAERSRAADALASAEGVLREAGQRVREIDERLAQTREAHARHEALREAGRERVAEVARRIAEVLDAPPAAALKAAGAEILDDLPGQEEIVRRLHGLKADRERLGGVNLRAEDEAQEVSAQLDGLTRERDDVIQAVQRLRQAIGTLNREGRQRLLEAFETVNANFNELFTRLFGGGTAALSLIESDDPLEAGLEITAMPPGKRPQVLSLLSGGEQALTAIALIFAVFLTNPSPICVMDEVDAPLDDANVERFCNLLDAMLERSETRFLIITHHPLTMARMHRLFGVTMIERGVSQLVSVDLETAEALREAG